MNGLEGILLGVSILNLVSVAYLYYLTINGRKPKASVAPVGDESQLREISQRVTNLEMERNRLNNRMRELEAKLKQWENRSGGVGPVQANIADPKPAAQTARSPVPPRSQPQTPAGSSTVRPAGPLANRPLETVPPAPADPVPPERGFGSGNFQDARSTPPPAANRTRPTLLYGRTADLGDGFSVGGLLEAPDRDAVFEIHRQGDTQAVYRVSDNPDAQRLALGDPYSYLNDACDYLTQPRSGSRIQTEQPGKLALQGEKWKIIEKAKISFY